MTVLDLRKFRLRSGESLRDEQEVEIAPIGDSVLDDDLYLREYQAESPGGVEELTTPYVADNRRLDLSAWARDGLVLALPDKILCRPDCAGLCPVCGGELNREPHTHEGKESDPRWAALAELRDRL